MNHKTGIKKPVVLLSSHAKKRLQQRGIIEKHVLLAALYGKKSRVQGGLFQRFFTTGIARKVQVIDSTISESELEKATGTAIITSESPGQPERTVVTVLPKNKPRRIQV